MKSTLTMYPFADVGEYLEWHHRTLLFLAPKQRDIGERTENGVDLTRKR